MLGMCAVPAFASPGAAHASSGKFTAPRASSAVKAWGSYRKINAHRVYVQVCIQKTGKAFAVGVEAVAYSSNYRQHAAIAAVILPETPGQHGCTQTNLRYTGHLKVYTFLGQGGRITKTTKMKSIY